MELQKIMLFMDTSLLDRAYDPEQFRKEGHQLVDLLADYLAAARTEPGAPAIAWRPPAEQYDHWAAGGKTAGDASLSAFFAEVLDGSVKIHRPQYMGHQLSPTAPAAALAGLLGDFLNNGMGVYEMGAPATAIERVVVKKVARAMGMPDAADGLLTSGGTLANLTALLCARSLKVSPPVWREGGGAQLALLVSEQAHYCVDRAVRIMGWGEDGIVKIPVDDQFRMRTDQLEAGLARARSAGRQVIAVVGSACTTATGAFDDLSAIADFCSRHDLWFHIDGAHGAAAVFSDRYRHLVAGLDRADSVAMDFHKMLMTPAIATALIFRDGRHAFHTFSQQADYLWKKEREEEWYNLAKRTFECTKLMMGVKVYTLIRTYGLELFDAYVTRVNDLGKVFGELVAAHPDFELAAAPQCNIVCFRYRNAAHDARQRDEHNARIRQAALENGQFYLVQTRLNGQTWLRVTLTNPFTEPAHLQGLLAHLSQLAVRREGVAGAG